MRIQQEQHDYDYRNSCGNLHRDSKCNFWFRHPDYHRAVDGEVGKRELLDAFQDHGRSFVGPDDALQFDPVVKFLRRHA